MMLAAQEPRSNDKLLALTDQLQSAINAGDWKNAAKLSSLVRDAVTQARNLSFAETTNEQVDTILNWLPENTETVVVAQEPFTISESNPNTEPGALTEARGYILGLLDAANQGKLFHALEGRTLRFALLTGRKFANHPTDRNNVLPLGLIAYQGCATYAFAKPVAEMASSGRPGTVIAGKQVWVSKGREYEPTRDADQRWATYLVALLSPDLILVCNDRDFFSSVVSRMTTRPVKQAFPPSLSEWKQMNRSAPFWGFRHFLPQPADTDPTDPRKGSLPEITDAGAMGVVMQLGVRTDGIRARWLSRSDTNPWQQLAKAGDFKGKAQSYRVSEGVWELNIRGDAQVEDFAVFALMAVLGFAMLV